MPLRAFIDAQHKKTKRKGCPTPLSPGEGEDSISRQPSSRSTMYTYGDVYGTEEEGLQAAEQAARGFQIGRKMIKRRA